MAQFNSLTDRVRQMLGGIPQTLSDIGNRVGSNMQWAGRQVQQNAPSIARSVGNSALRTINPNLPTAIQSVRTVGQQLQPKLVKQYTSNLRQGISNIADPNRAQQEIDSLGKIRGAGIIGQAGMYGANRYLAPIIQTPARFNQLKSGIQKGNMGDVAMGTLGMLGGIAALSPDPLSDIGMPLFDLTKGYVAGMREYGNKTGSKASFDPKAVAYALNRGRQAFTMEKPVGVGEAVTDNPTGQTIGNILELPLALATARKLGKGTPLFDKKTIEDAKRYLGNDARASIGKFAQLVETNKNANRMNLGELGDEIQSIAEGIWGNRASHLTNKQLKNAFDLILQQMDAGKGYDRSLAFGLSTKNVRDLVDNTTTKPQTGAFKSEFKLQPGETQADMIKRIQGIHSPGSPIKNAVDAVWNNDPSLKGVIDNAYARGDMDTVKRLLPQVPEQYKANYVSKAVDPFEAIKNEAKKYKNFAVFEYDFGEKFKTGQDGKLYFDDGSGVIKDIKKYGYDSFEDIWNKANKGVASTSQPKTPRTIKVAGQSRTQQPISSPASGSVGTVAGASGGQTSQPILETAPLNKSIPQRGFAESVQTNKKTPAEIKPELEKIRYEPISNAETMAQADKIIQTDELKALDFAKNNTDTTANSVSLKLIEKYLDQGRFSEANDLISAVAPRFTKAGQEIQILSTYGRLTPTGAIKYAQTLINQANKANPKLNLKLTEANTKIITEYANKVQSLPVGSRERIVATAQLMQKITDQVPPSIGQKIATIQTMMQLLNPKTAIRNIIGNTLFTGAENISDVFATGLDRITSIITGRRSKVLPSITAQGRGFIKGGREGFQDAMLGIDTSGGVSSQFEIKGKTFTDPILGSLEKALNIELRVPDRAAYTAAFEGSLNNQMRAAGVTKATPEMIEIAHADGLYRTFQDNSRLAQIFSGIKKTLNKIGTPDGKFGLGDFIIKYPKTPANILSRGLDYSPAGFVKGIYEGIRPFMTGQPFNQKQFVENLSRAMVGTGLISAGYILAKNGIISGKNDKDYDISSVKRTTGQGAFKLNVSALARFFQSGGQKQDDQNGDTLVSYDWAQPISILIAMGANSAMGGNAEDMASIASDNLQAGVDTLTGQSMVKNLVDYAGGVKDKGFVGATQDMALNSATGFIPSVVRQTANVFDPLQRSTYAETPAGVAINKAKATIPFVRNTLEPKLDVFGKEMPNYEGSGLQRLFDIFVNPAFVTKIQENPAAKEVIDIYQRSGLTTQAPRVADSKIKINGQDVKVSPRQYTEYQRYIGTKTDETFNALMNDPLFRKSSDEEKAKLLQGILTDINSAAKIELFGNNPKSIPQDVKNIIKSSTNATDRMLTLTKEGNLKMAMGDIEYPKLTGNTELDKKLISSYQGKLTQKANEVVAMFEAGEITAAQAESELSKIIQLKNKVSTKKAKKAPKITVRKLSAPKVAKSARIKIKIPKLKKPKTLKLKKYTVKLSK